MENKAYTLKEIAGTASAFRYQFSNLEVVSLPASKYADGTPKYHAQLERDGVVVGTLAGPESVTVICERSSR